MGAGRSAANHAQTPLCDRSLINLGPADEPVGRLGSLDPRRCPLCSRVS